MQYVPDFDLEELETRLYSQVFHAFGDSEQTTLPEVYMKDVSNRQVNCHSVNNVRNISNINVNRYWCKKNDPKPLTQSRSEPIYGSVRENKLPEIINFQDNFQNNDHDTSQITRHEPNEHSDLQLPNQNPIFQTSNDIHLDRKQRKIQNRKDKKMRKKLRKIDRQNGELANRSHNIFMYNLGQTHMAEINPIHSGLNINGNFDPNSNSNSDPNFDPNQRVPYMPNNSTPNFLHENEQKTIDISDEDEKIEKYDGSHYPSLFLNKNEVILVSDSDDDSVTEVPLPPKSPIPCFNVDSDSDQSDEIIDPGTEKPEKLSKDDNNSKSNINSEEDHNSNSDKSEIDVIGGGDSKENSQNLIIVDELSTDIPTLENSFYFADDEFVNVVDDENSKETTEKVSDNTKENNSDSPAVDKTAKISKLPSVKVLEKERAELLNTPDSMTNDFIDGDVDNLKKRNFRFNFSLHGSDLDLTEKEFVKPQNIPVPVTDLYETESSCSEAGTTPVKAQVFTEPDFESPTKELFCEPGLASFSNFITPNRKNDKIKSIMTKTSLSKIRDKAKDLFVFHGDVNVNNDNVLTSFDDIKLTGENLNDFSSSEYNSDYAITQSGKKSKKRKKRTDKKTRKKASSTIISDETNDNQSNCGESCKEKSNEQFEESPSKTEKKKKKTSTVNEMKDDNNGDETLNKDKPVAEESTSKQEKKKKKSSTLNETRDDNNGDEALNKDKSVNEESISKKEKKKRRNITLNELKNCDDNNLNEETTSNKEKQSHKESSTKDNNKEETNKAEKKSKRKSANSTAVSNEAKEDNANIIDVERDKEKISNNEELSSVETTEESTTKDKNNKESDEINKISLKETSKTSNEDSNNKEKIKEFSFIKAWNSQNAQNSPTTSGKISPPTKQPSKDSKQILDQDIILLSDSDESDEETNRELFKNLSFIDDFVPVRNATETTLSKEKINETGKVMLNVSGGSENLGESSNCNNADYSFEKDYKSNSEEEEEQPSRSKNNRNLVPNPYNTNKMTGTFKDFFTHDMKKFYDESWGHEEFNVDKVLSSMPKDASKWEVIAEDKQWMRSRKRGPVCLRCRERGHYRYQCVQQPALHRCSTCGAVGHQHHRCPNLICTTCGTRGDYHTTSCKKCLNYGKIKCSLCRMPGHEHKNCPDLWRRYHLTVRDDSELEMGPNNLKPVPQRWCSGCAKKGHFQHECKNFSSEHFPTLPNIINYGQCYNATLNIPKQNEPDTNIPVLGNTKLSQIRNYKNDVEKNNNKKFSFILQAMRRQCKEFSNLQFLPVIEELDKDLKNNRFDGKKISTMYKLRNILKGRMS